MEAKPKIWQAARICHETARALGADPSPMEVVAALLPRWPGLRAAADPETGDAGALAQGLYEAAVAAARESLAVRIILGRPLAEVA